MGIVSRLFDSPVALAKLIANRSSRNVRIERMWVEVGNHFCRQWKGFFTRLERLHGLKVDNPLHLWLLHVVFLNGINGDCVRFCEIWNGHQISGVAHNQTPAVCLSLHLFTLHYLMTLQGMRFISMMRNQLEPRADSHENTDPELLNRFYGVAGHSQRAPGQTGAGHSDNESDDGGSEGGEFEDNHQQNFEIDPDADAEDVVRDIERSAVRVPLKNSPFQSEEDDVHFAGMLRENSDVLSLGFNVFDVEHEDHCYPETEEIAVGFRKRRRLEVTLSNEIWRPRAIEWVRALLFLERLLHRE